ncbi:potassium channel family protein [Acidobacteriota bacterium]
MILRIWVSVLNKLSEFEFKIADKLNESAAIFTHFLIFWILPILLLLIPFKYISILSIIIALFYIYVLFGDIFLSVFGHENLEKKRGMIDITTVPEMRAEIIGSLIKYIGGVISFATIFRGLQILLNGKAFIVQTTSSPFSYFDMLYYSLVTITTVGYGDITPIHWISKLFVMSEIMFGLGFVLLLFTMMISLYIDIQQKKKNE